MTLPVVSARNWLEPATISWSFQHLEQLFPTETIHRGDVVAVLPRSPADLADLPVPQPDGTVRPVADVVATTDTDAWLVLHRGAVVAEEYAGTMTPDTRHPLMSVSKSVVSLVAGALTDRGLLRAEAPVTEYLPALAGTGWSGATVRHLLDMRSGVRFCEEYLDPDSDVRRLDEAAGWAPPRPGSPASIKALLAGLRRERPHGGPFVYRSAETDVLGWACQEAAGAPFPRLASDLLWSRMGAEADALVCVDAEGTSLFDGGICATLRDLARFGALVLARGRSHSGEQVVPASWVDDLFAGGPDSAAAYAAGGTDYGLPGGSYRSQFWSPTAGGDVVLCLGIHGQLVYVDRARELVGVKLSSWPLPLDEAKGLAAVRMFAAIADHLAAG